MYPALILAKLFLQILTNTAQQRDSEAKRKHPRPHLGHSEEARRRTRRSPGDIVCEQQRRPPAFHRRGRQGRRRRLQFMHGRGLHRGQLQEHLLRRARDDVDHRRLVPDAPRLAPRMAVPRARRGPGGSPPAGTKAGGRGHDPEAEDGGDGGPGDAPAVPAGAVRDAGGAARRDARRAARSERHRRPGAHSAGAPGPRRVGRRRRARRVRPGAVRQRRGGRVQAAAHVHAVRRRRAHLRRAEPRRGGDQGRAGAPPAQVRARAVAGVRAPPGVQAHRRARERRGSGA